MIIKNLTVKNFRNYNSLNLEFNENKPINIIISPNGMGKSNLLESIYFLSYLRSFRHVQDKEIIKKGADFFFIESNFISNSIINKIMVKFKNKKEILFNDKKINKYSEMLGKLISVLFCNEDIFIVNGNPNIKRKFFDVFISVVDINYLYCLKKYQEIIKQKNFILKGSKNIDLLNVYNHQLTPVIFYIQQKRNSIIEQINKRFQENFYQLGLFNEKVKIIYISSFNNIADNEEQIYSKLSENINKELNLGYSIYGPHRDHYLFLINGIIFNKYASLGQTRLCALVLKLIQSEYYKDFFNIPPILLLDDVILELDKEKQKRFIDKISNYKQLFFTFTNKEYLNLFKNKEFINEIEVENGTIKQTY